MTKKKNLILRTRISQSRSLSQSISRDRVGKRKENRLQFPRRVGPGGQQQRERRSSCTNCIRSTTCGARLNRRMGMDRSLTTVALALVNLQLGAPRPLIVTLGEGRPRTETTPPLMCCPGDGDRPLEQTANPRVVARSYTLALPDAGTRPHLQPRQVHLAGRVRAVCHCPAGRSSSTRRPATT